MNPGRRNEWEERLLVGVPEEDDVLGRNAAITAHYASWYRDYRPLFKWAGAAAFASYKIRLVLMAGLVVERASEVAELVFEEKTVERLRQSLVGVRDLDLLRQTNFLVFRDVGWAHLAYQSGGLRAVEAAAREDAASQTILAGFAAIDKGRKLLRQDPTRRPEAARCIWKGNKLLLRHEQEVTIQNQMRELSYGVDVVLSWWTSLDFDADHLHTDAETYSAFADEFAKRFRRAGNIKEFADRWVWIEKVVWPRWRKQDTKDETLPLKLSRLIVAGELPPQARRPPRRP